jgi:hypothetical protein
VNGKNSSQSFLRVSNSNRSGGSEGGEMLVKLGIILFFGAIAWAVNPEVLLLYAIMILILKFFEVI